MAEPVCCSEPMIRNAFTEEWECSASYFWLTEQENPLLDDLGKLREERPISPYDREVYEHWLTSRRSFEEAGRG